MRILQSGLSGLMVLLTKNHCLVYNLCKYEFSGTTNDMEDIATEEWSSDSEKKKNL